MVEILDLKELEDWLSKNPNDWQEAISTRSVLRALPAIRDFLVLSKRQNNLKKGLLIKFLRAIFINQAFNKGTEFKNNIDHAFDALSRSEKDINNSNGFSFYSKKAYEKYARANYNILEKSNFAAIKNSHHAIVAAKSNYTVESALETTRAERGLFAAYSTDCNYLEGGISSADLLGFPLWRGENGNPLGLYWFEIKGWLRELNPNWQFWIDWYQSKLDGTLHSGLTQVQQDELYYQIATFPNELWEEGAEAVNHRIAELMEEVKEGEGNDFEEEIDEPYELELPPQNKAALTFKTNEDGQAQLAPASENEQVLSDEGAKARHEETLYSGEELIRLFDPNKSGANAVAPLIEKTQRCLDALGKTPQEVDIDRLIPRGEALRQIANREENRDDFTDVPPLPDGFKEALNNFLAAYNPYIALDPVLEKRDQIRLGPDEKGQLITTVEGQVIIDALTEANLLEEDTKDILDEVTNTAEGSTDPESRANRYYSESLRNLGRNILTEVDKAYKSIKNKGKIASEVCFDAVVVGAALIHQDFARKRAQIILKHEKWFVKNFGRTLWMKKMMVGFIHRIKTNPLLTDDDN